MSDNEKKSRGKDVLEDVKSLLKEEEGGGGSGGSDDYDDTMPRKKGGNAFVAIFLVALLVIIGFLGYVLVSEDARGKVAAFIRGDLFKIEKERAEDLQKLYQDKMEQMAEKFGDIRLEYFPRDAKVHIYQRLFRYASLKEQKAEAWGDFREIPNDTLTLAEGEELPFLSIENLPVRVRGQICARDGQFYPANQMFCPDLVDKCKTAMAQGQVSEECDKGKLLSVQYCPQDKLYYPDEGNMVLLCPDGKTLMEPTEVPIFVYHYDFLFERKDFISKAEHYEEGDCQPLRQVHREVPAGLRAPARVGGGQGQVHRGPQEDALLAPRLGGLVGGHEAGEAAGRGAREDGRGREEEGGEGGGPAHHA